MRLVKIIKEDTLFETGIGIAKMNDGKFMAVYTDGVTAQAVNGKAHYSIEDAEKDAQNA